MGISIDQSTINNGMETMKNLTKLAANVTNPKPPHQPQEKKQENMNQPHTQTVEVKVGEQTPASKPTIIKEKSETHVHKVFPDQRELSERECAVRELELKNEHEFKMKELEFRMIQEEQNRKERREREEYDRKERERRREREKRFSRNMCIGLGVAGAVALGCAALDLYTNSGHFKSGRLALPKQSAVPGEGNVT